VGLAEGEGVVCSSAGRPGNVVLSKVVAHVCQHRSLLWDISKDYSHGNAVMSSVMASVVKVRTGVHLAAAVASQEDSV
jgi:hypothetical protein